VNQAEAVERINGILAHVWMIRTFLKHADEIQEREEFLEVPRTLFDSIRATEPAFQKGDHQEYLRRIRGKLSRMRRVSDFFSSNYLEVSDHTNFQMAALSLSTAVQEIEKVLSTMTTDPQTVEEKDPTVL